MTFDFRLREREERDLPFVAGSWLDSFAREGLAQRCAPFRNIKTAIGARIRQHARDLPCIVAHDPDDADALWGFAIGEREGDHGILHWVYVTRHRRAAGLGRALVDAWDAAHGPVVAHRYAARWTVRHSRELPLCEEALR